MFLIRKNKTYFRTLQSVLSIERRDNTNNNRPNHYLRLVKNKKQRFENFQTAVLHPTNNTNLINNHLIDRFTNFH